MPDILDPSAILTSLPSLLAPACILKYPQDAIVSLIHSVMIALSFRVIGVDDSDSITTYENNILPEQWNAHGPANYTLRYKHEQSSLEFVVKVVKLGPRTITNAIAVESDKTASLDIQTADYTSQSFFPYTPSDAGAQPLVHGYISSNRIADFVQSYKLKIIQKLVPGLRKEGYTETQEETSSHSGQVQPRPQAPRAQTPPHPRHDPFGVYPSHISPNNPLSIGRRDLDPLPSHPSPFGPSPLFRGPSGGDGMYVGRDHPIFSDRFTHGRGGGHHEGPWGGDGFLPPMGAPPGARFDPIGPFGGPFGQGPSRGGPFGGSGGGSARPPRSSEPDNDEFMPPGMGDMFS